MKRCPRCGEVKAASEFYANKGHRDGLSTYCATCQKLANLESFRRLQQRAFIHLGNHCQRCGFDADWRAFQIDHIAGDGAAHRATGAGLGRNLYLAVLRDDGSQYALLCANCNVIKRMADAEHVGSRVYTRVVPTERVVRPSQRWTSEQKAAQSAKSRARWDDPAYRAKMVARNSEVAKARWASGERLGRSKREAPVS